jgi:tripartite ATP-independent transporter DctM subunit
MGLAILVAFLFLILIGMPIGFCFGIVSIGSYVLLGGNLQAIPQKMYAGLNSFTFVAIPFFIFVGQIMSRGQISVHLVRFAQNIIGHVRGGLAHVSILASMIFAGLTGSATSDVAGLGPIEIEMMTKGKYDLEFASAVTASSAILGPIIPPSICMVIYAVIAGNVSVPAMFLGGIVPGILIGGALMVTSYVIAKKRNYPIMSKRASLKEIVVSFWKTLPALMLPIIILGGILLGIFTATEASAIAVLYSVIICKYVLKTINFKDLPGLLLETVKVTSPVMFIIATASAMGWVLTVLQIPQQVAAFFMQYAHSQFAFLLLTNILLLFIGMILDQSPAMLIMVPILSPVATQLGINPLAFGLIVCINLCIGLITPPVGMTLFVTSNVAHVKLERLYKSIIPFAIAEMAVLFLITYVPQTLTFIPSLFGYK